MASLVAETAIASVGKSKSGDTARQTAGGCLWVTGRIEEEGGGNRKETKILNGFSELSCGDRPVLSIAESRVPHLA